ncbi:MAG: hypothetical protein NC038_08450 [Paludibacter sp.]|nr:hypothetical protein [Bacteroidales bacterium]MCM1068388.1 hypothetical protein [Prevotella sp.]MCM1354537.1 hypothetical protein [Bacteroides sp.]MCM1443454.1 hypothetical protein [Muribaculum sp.]MCM1482645.1 hypothetical protein [Paludibacter sp.]
MNTTTSLPEFEDNLSKLLQQYAELEKQNQILRRANETQRGELLRTHQELENIKQQYKTLQTALAVTVPTESKEQAKRTLTRLIRMVDKALEEVARN